MTLYHLTPQIRQPDKFVVFGAERAWKRARELLIEGSGKPPHPGEKLRARTQEGIWRAELTDIDFIHSFGGIPIFSRRFKEEIPTDLFEQLEFHAIDIDCEGSCLQMFAARVRNRIQLVDYEATGVFREPSQFLPFRLLPGINENFLIARDTHALCQHVYVVTSRFKALAQELKLKIGFREALIAT